MINTRVLGAGLLALLFLGRKSPRGTVTIDEPNVRVVVPKAKPAKKPAPVSLEQELAAEPVRSSEPAREKPAPESLEEELAAPSSPPIPGPSKPAAPLVIDVSRPKVVTKTDAELADMRARAEMFAAAAQKTLPQQPLPTAQKEAVSLPSSPAPKAKATAVDVDVVYQKPFTNVSPTLQPKPQGPQIPAGYDPAKAKAGASAIASHLAKKGPASYSRDQLRIWQRHAALAQDGLYGGSTRGALIAFGVKDPPRAFFKPVATIPYVPPEQRI